MNGPASQIDPSLRRHRPFRWGEPVVPTGCGGGGRRLALLAGVAGALGIGVGGIAFALFRVIALITNVCFYGRWSLADVPPTTAHLGPVVILIPAVGGLLVGLIARFGSHRIRGHGIDAVMEAVLFHGSRVDPEVAIYKPISSAIVIGTGGPFGVEGPIIQTGGAVGSVVGQLLHLTAGERKTLLAAGAAAGLAATFSTPIAAVILALELILFEYKARSFIPLVIASTLATGTRFVLLGRAPIVAVGALKFGFPHALGWDVALGVLSGLAAAAFIHALGWFEAQFDHFKRIGVSDLWWPALAGLVIGLVGYFVPRTMGPGYLTIADLLNGRLGVGMILLVLVCKPLVTLTALGSRTSGGTLAPMFMTGAALGGLFAYAVNAVCPGVNLSPGACAVLAMAAFFGAAARAPFAFILFAFEMTRSYDAVLPLMLVVVIAYGVGLATTPHSVMTMTLVRKGLPISQEMEADVFRRVLVSQVMDDAPVTVSASTTVAELSRRIARGEADMLRHPAFPVIDEQGHLVSIITRGDLVRALAQDSTGSVPVAKAGTPRPLVAFPDEVVEAALSRMLRRGCGRLPVVSRADPGRVVGYLGRTAILNARLRHVEEEQVRERGWNRRPPARAVAAVTLPGTRP